MIFKQSRPKLRERYGLRHVGAELPAGQAAGERGVPFVSIANTGWDTHDNLVLQLRDGFASAKVGVGLLPALDQALSALIGDLSDRGLLDETLVVVMGEFGTHPSLIREVVAIIGRGFSALSWQAVVYEAVK